MDDPDVPLANRLRSGEDRALGELFDRHRERLWRTVRFRMDRRLGARIDPDDVLQEAFLAAADRLDSFRAQPELPAFLWLRWIVTQSLTDLHRRHLAAEKRSAEKEIALEACASQSTSACLAVILAESITSPSKVLAGEERFAMLQRAISTLSDTDQEIIALRHFEDLTNLEAARLLDLAPTAASNRYVRAIARLKDVLSAIPELASWPG